MLPVVDQASDYWTDEQAFAIRFAAVFEYLRTSWEDPELPDRLLRRPVPREEARLLTRRIYVGLTLGGLRYGDSIMRRVEPDLPRASAQSPQPYPSEGAPARR